jgi:uncharacterized protein YndB with AHSA1/START domain
MTTATLPTSLRLTRLIKAPRARVYAAWTTPADIQKWLCSPTVKMLEAKVDARIGGEYVFRMHKPEMGEMTRRGIYREVTPPSKLVFTWSGACGSAENEETLVTVDFVDKNGATEVTITHERFLSQESCDQHNQGWTMCMDNMEKLLAQ